MFRQYIHELSIFHLHINFSKKEVQNNFWEEKSFHLKIPFD